MSADVGTRKPAAEQYEKSFRRNRDDAIGNGYDLCCPVCGCAFNDDTDEWEMNHDGPLHRLYDALKAEANDG